MAWIPSNETRAKKRLLFLAPTLVRRGFRKKGEKRKKREKEKELRLCVNRDHDEPGCTQPGR